MPELVTTKPESRDRRFDFYRGLLIIGVVTGHMITALRQGGGGTPWLHTFLRTYDMPMFAFITGVFLRQSCERHSVGINLLNKLTAILLPLILWSVIISGDFSFGSLWYLWSTLIASCGVIMAHRVTQRIRPLRPILLVLLIAAFHMPHLTLHYAGFLAFPMVIGYSYRGISEAIEKRKLRFYAKSAVVILFVVLLCFWNPKWNIWNIGCDIFGNSGNVPLNLWRMAYRGLLGVTGALSMKYFFDLLYEKAEATPQLRRVMRGVTAAGTCTMEIYILQTLCVEIYGAKAYAVLVRKIGANPAVCNTDFLGWVIAPLLAIAAVVCCYFMQKWIKKIPVVGQFVFGGTVKKWKAHFSGRRGNAASGETKLG